MGAQCKRGEGVEKLMGAPMVAARHLLLSRGQTNELNPNEAQRVVSRYCSLVHYNRPSIAPFEAQ